MKTLWKTQLEYRSLPIEELDSYKLRYIGSIEV